MKAQAERSRQQNTKEVESQLSNVSQKMQDMEQRLQKMEAATSKVDDIAGHCKQTADAVAQLQKDQTMIQPLIEQKVAEATEHAANHLYIYDDFSL